MIKFLLSAKTLIPSAKLIFFTDAIWLINDKKWLFFNMIGFYYSAKIFKNFKKFLFLVSVYLCSAVIPGKANGK